MLKTLRLPSTALNQVLNMASKALCDLNSASLCSSISLVCTPDSLCSGHTGLLSVTWAHQAQSLYLVFCLKYSSFVYRSDLNSNSQEISLASLAKVSAPPYTTASHTVTSFDHHIIPFYHLIISLEIIYSLFGCLFLYPLQCKLFERLCYACLIYWWSLSRIDL